jgi:hypothetical protein
VVPIVNGLEKQYGAQIDFRRVNILDASSQALMEAYSFGTAPQLFLIDRHGKIAASWDLATAQELSQAFDQLLRGSE